MGVWLRLFSHGFHGIHRSLVASVLPRISRNSQKFGCVCSPTDFTDLHGWLGYVYSPTEFRSFWRRRASHRFHRFSQMVRVWNSVNSVCSVGAPTPPVNLCKSAICGRIIFCCVGVSHRIHGIHGTHRSLWVLLAAWVWQDAIPS